MILISNIRINNKNKDRIYFNSNKFKFHELSNVKNSLFIDIVIFKINIFLYNY